MAEMTLEDIVQEVAALLRRIASRDIRVTVDGETWDEVYAGNVAFLLSTGDRVVVFNDNDALDYVDTVQLHDGRTADFDVEHDPCWHLSDDEREAVYAVFKAATRPSETP